MCETATVPKISRPTLLDPQETPRQQPADVDWGESPATHAESIAFRHTGWAFARSRTHEALHAAGTPEQSLQAFKDCGRNAWVQKSTGDVEKFRVVCQTCKNRWCQPCGRTRAGTIATRVADLLQRKAARLITLTIKHTDQPLSLQLAHLYRSFAALRRCAPWKSTQDGGVAFLETKWKPEKNAWHPHLHVVSVGKWIDLDALKAAWWRITGDSFVVDVRLVRTGRDVVSYVTKYVTKPVNSAIYRDLARLTEAVQALKGKRMLLTYGTWKNECLTTPIDGEDWLTIAPLPELIARGKHGDDEALRILALLQPERTCPRNNDSPSPSP